jgi:hypothetical protein
MVLSGPCVMAAVLGWQHCAVLTLHAAYVMGHI